VGLQRLPSRAISAWHLYTVTLPRRDRVAAFLAEKGIETAVHYPVPPHLSGAYRDDAVWPRLPVTERLAAGLLSLPIYPTLSDDAVRHTARTLLDALETCAGEQP
jgi:dTDP-4-amino-4,6-dideoxygalactose transaminase